LRRLLHRLQSRALQPPEVEKYCIATPERKHVARSPRGVNDHEGGLPMAAEATTMTGEPQPRPLALAMELRVLFADLREELVREQRAAQSAALEQGLHLQAQLCREVEELRKEAKRIREHGEHLRPHKCPRCCRESVEGAVQALMEGVENAVSDALQLEDLQLCGEGWQALADEVWESISVVSPPTLQNAGAATWGAVEAPAPPRARTRNPPSCRLAGLAPLRKVLQAPACGVAAPEPELMPESTQQPAALLAEHRVRVGTGPLEPVRRNVFEAKRSSRRAWSGRGDEGRAAVIESCKENANPRLQRATNKLDAERPLQPSQSPARMHCFLR